MEVNLTPMATDLQYIFGYKSQQLDSKYTLLAAEIDRLDLDLITGLISAIKTKEKITLNGVTIPDSGFCRIYLYYKYSHGMRLENLDQSYQEQQLAQVDDSFLLSIQNMNRGWVTFLTKPPFDSLALNKVTKETANLYQDLVIHDIIRNIYLNYWDGELVSISFSSPFNDLITERGFPGLVLFNIPERLMPENLKSQTKRLEEAAISLRKGIAGSSSTGARNHFNETTFLSSLNSNTSLITPFTVTETNEITTNFSYSLDTDSLSVFCRAASSTIGQELTHLFTDILSSGDVSTTYKYGYRNLNRMEGNIFTNDLLPPPVRTTDGLTSIPIDTEFLYEYKQLIEDGKTTDPLRVAVHKKESSLSPVHYISSKKKYNTFMTSDKFLFSVRKTDSFNTSVYQSNISRQITENLNSILNFPIQILLSSALEVPGDVTAFTNFNESAFGCSLFNGVSLAEGQNVHVAITDRKEISNLVTLFLSSIELNNFKLNQEIPNIVNKLMNPKKSRMSYWLNDKFRCPGYVGEDAKIYNISTGKINTKRLIRSVGLTDSNSFCRTFEHNFIWTNPTATVADLYSRWSNNEEFNIPIEIMFKIDSKTLSLLKELVKCKTITDYATWYTVNYTYIIEQADFMYEKYLERNRQLSIPTASFSNSNTEQLEWVKSWVTCFNTFFTEVLTQTTPKIPITIPTLTTETVENGEETKET